MLSRCLYFVIFFQLFFFSFLASSADCPWNSLTLGGEKYVMIHRLGKGSEKEVFLVKSLSKVPLFAFSLAHKDMSEEQRKNENERLKLLKKALPSSRKEFCLPGPWLADASLLNVSSDEWHCGTGQLKPFVRGLTLEEYEEVVEDEMDDLEGKSLDEAEELCLSNLSFMVDFFLGPSGILKVLHDSSVIHKDLQEDNIIVRLRGQRIEKAFVIDWGRSSFQENFHERKLFEKTEDLMEALNTLKDMPVPEEIDLSRIIKTAKETMDQCKNFDELLQHFYEAFEKQL